MRGKGECIGEGECVGEGECSGEWEGEDVILEGEGEGSGTCSIVGNRATSCPENPLVSLLTRHSLMNLVHQKLIGTKDIGHHKPRNILEKILQPIGKRKPIRASGNITTKLLQAVSILG
ncbi:hypothetical protein Tco_1022321 [Tanacetum coccineum]